MTPLWRITLDEVWTAASTHRGREKSATARNQGVGAFARSLMIATEWSCPADAVAVRAAKVLGLSHGLTLGAALVRMFSHYLLAAIALAEANKTKDSPFAVVDLIHEASGRRAYAAFGGRDVTPETVEGYAVERCTTVNVSLLIRATRAAAACNGLVGFDAAMMPPPDSEAFAAIMKPYNTAQLPDVIEESAMKKAETAARRAGSEARRVAMGSVVDAGQRKPSNAA
jgi:hypothetical protein